MRQFDLYALVRATLLDGFTARPALGPVEVAAVYQPQMIGMTSAPNVTMQTISASRYGAVGRRDRLAVVDFDHEETQWWETTLQIGALARRDPNDPAFPTLASAMDICKAASDILQSDTGLAVLAVQRVRPLRITALRNLQWVNESDQYEAMPNFDLTLVHPEIILGATPTAQTVGPDIGRV